MPVLNADVLHYLFSQFLWQYNASYFFVCKEWYAIYNRVVRSKTLRANIWYFLYHLDIERLQTKYINNRVMKLHIRCNTKKYIETLVRDNPIKYKPVINWLQSLQ
jgi:hypothetical protein